MNKRYVCARYPFHLGGEIVASAIRPFKITYATSGSERNTGFQFSYQIMDVGEWKSGSSILSSIGCGGVFENEQGVIQSPSYPDNYMSHMYCIYLITVPDVS